YHPHPRLRSTSVMTDVLYPAEDRACDSPSGVGSGVSRRSSRPVLVRDPGESAASPPASPGIGERAAELALMRGVAAHQRDAELELVRKIIGLVRTRARVLTRSHPDADDAMQT